MARRKKQTIVDGKIQPHRLKLVNTLIFNGAISSQFLTRRIGMHYHSFWTRLRTRGLPVGEVTELARALDEIATATREAAKDLRKAARGE